MADSRSYQQAFDIRHRTVGTALRGYTTFDGVLYHGAIYPVSVTAEATAHAQYGSQSGARGEGGGQNAPAGTGRGGVVLEFLYNPASISMTYSANAALLPRATIDPSQLNPPAAMTDNNTTISFDLLFDRTYEVMNGSDLGVLTDIRALERLCGITEDAPVMYLAPVNIQFSGALSFQFKALISTFSVEYTHFSARMVPMRCGVGITAQRLSSGVTATSDDIAAAALLADEKDPRSAYTPSDTRPKAAPGLTEGQTDDQLNNPQSYANPVVWNGTTYVRRNENGIMAPIAVQP